MIKKVSRSFKIPPTRKGVRKVIKIKSYIEYVNQIKRELGKEGLNLELFTKSLANGIRDGPQAKEILRIQGEFTHQLYHYAFKRPLELKQEGYSFEDIQIAIAHAEAQKAASIQWIKENYLRLKELKEELESEKKKKEESKTKTR